MSSPKAFHIVSNCTGHNLGWQQDKPGLFADTEPRTVVRNPKPDDKDQQWIIAPDPKNTSEDSQSCVVALKNVGRGDYLRAEGGGLGNKIRFSKDPHYWTISTENVVSLRAVRLSPKEFPKAFMNHHNAGAQDGAVVHIWDWQGNNNNAHNTSWYFVEAGLPPFDPKKILVDGVSYGGGGNKVDTKELEKREQATAQKEKDLADQDAKQEKDRDELKASQDVIAKQQAELEQREEAAARKEKDAAAQGAEQRKAMEQREAALKKLEEAVAQKEKEAGQKKPMEQLAPKDDKAAKRTAELEEREKALAQKVKKAAAQEAEQKKSEEHLKAQTDAVDKREQALAQKEKELAARENRSKEQSQPAPQATNNGSHVREEMQRKLDVLGSKLDKAESELAAVKARNDKQSEQNKKKASALARKEAELIRKEEKLNQRRDEAQQAPHKPTAASNGPSGPSEADMLRAKNENLKLQIRNKLLEGENERLKSASQSGFSQGANGQIGDDGLKFSCGHVLLPPPRKIGREMVGILYKAQ